MPRLSVITVCLNEEKYIAKTIESVTNQTFKDLEYIVIDGQSADRTVEIINGYRHLIQTIVSEKDSGIYAAMNKGIGLASGEYLLFLNGGDYLQDEAVLEKVFSVPPQADILYGDMLFERQGQKTLWNMALTKVNGDYILGTSLPHPAAFIKRQLFLDHGLYDQSYKFVADHAFFMRELIKYKAKVCYRPVIVSVANTYGISCNQDNLPEIQREQAKARSEFISGVLAIKRYLINSGPYQFYKKIKKTITNRHE